MVRQNKDRLESAFGVLSLALAALCSILLFVPDKAGPWGHSACSLSNLQRKAVDTSDPACSTALHRAVLVTLMVHCEVGTALHLMCF